MKKWLIVIVIILLACSIAIYFFIPAVVTFSRVEKVAANTEEAVKFFKETGLRKKWLSLAGPGYQTTDSFIRSGNYNFFMTGIHAQSFNITIHQKSETLNSQLLMIPQGVDSTIVIWESHIDAGWNPVGRINAYLRARQLKAHFVTLLNAFDAYVSVPVNVYNFPIITEQVKDTILIAYRKVFTFNPSVSQVYEMADQLKKYASAANANLTNAPMLNISVFDSTHYQCTVALPLDKALPAKGALYPSRMIPGKILVETVHGGPSTIKFAFTRLSDYYRQHKLTSPALIFESLIPDRRS